MQLVTVEINVQTIDVPTPPIDFGFQAVTFPTIGPYEIPDIRLQPVSVDLPDINIDPVSIPVPGIAVGVTDIELGETPPIPIPDVDLPELLIETFDIEVLGQELSIIDPFGTRLVGGRVGFDRIGPFDLGSIPVIDVDVSRGTVTTPGFSRRLPTITTPGLDIDTPDVPTFALPNVQIPTDFRLVGTLAVPDPLSIDPEVSTNFAPLRQQIFGAFPAQLISDPLVWSFETAVSGFQSLIGSGGLTTVKDTIDAALDAALGDDTKERLQERRSDE